MSPVPLPATLPRRLAAATYDALLLLALWVIVTLFDVIARDALHLPAHPRLLQVLLFLVGLGFFGWFWTHGGQTLGMRAWRLRVRRGDGGPLRWPIAALRYACAWVSWGAAALGILWSLGDPRRRCFHDIVSGTEVILIPKPVSASATTAPGQNPTS